MSTLANLMAILDQERALLLEAIKLMPDEALTLKGLVGAWSIKNVLAHLADQEGLVAQVLTQRLVLVLVAGMTMRPGQAQSLHHPSLHFRRPLP